MPEPTRSKGKSSKGSAPPAMRVTPARLNEPAGVTPSQKAAVETLYSAFARRLAERLSGILRAEISFQFNELTDEPFSRMRDRSTGPACLAVLSIGAEGLQAALELDFGLAMVLVETLLGGKTSLTDPISRELTEIEQHLLLDVWQAVIDELAAAYKPSGMGGVQLRKLESNLSTLRIFSPDDVVSCASMQAKLGEGEWQIRVLHPANLIKALSESGSPPSNEPAKRPLPDQNVLLDLLAPIELRLDARLDGPRIPVKDLVNLRSGDVLHLFCPLTQEIAGFVNGDRKLTGKIVLAGRNRGFRIQSLND